MEAAVAEPRAAGMPRRSDHGRRRDRDRVRSGQPVCDDVTGRTPDGSELFRRLQPVPEGGLSCDMAHAVHAGYP